MIAMWKKLGRCYPSWLELLPFSLIFFALVYTGVYAHDLPAIIPSHFGGSGMPDAWTSKNFFSVYGVPLIGLIVYLTTALLNGCLIIFPENPGRFMSFSEREKEALGMERLEVIRTFLARTLWFTNTLVTAMFAYLSYGSVNTSLGRQSGLGWGMWVFFVAIIVSCFWMTVKIFTMVPPTYRQKDRSRIGK